MAAKEKCSSRWSAWLAPILLLLAALPASALTARATETRAWEKTSAPPDSRPVESLQLLNLHQQNATVGYDSVLGSPLAAESAPTGTALARQLGQEGEQAVGITGPKVGIEMPSGVTRFPDQFDAATNVLDEVKNVQSLSYTQQLRDYTAFTQQNGGTFNLWVRPSTQLSGPLQQAINDGLINLNYIPGAK